MVRTPSVEVSDSLLAAADRLLVQAGPSALSVRRIAAEAGVAPMCVYNRFGGKSGIIDHLFITGFDRLGAELAAVDTAGAAEALAQCGERYWGFAMAHPALYAVMFDRAVAGYVPGEEAHRHAAESFAAFVAHVRRAIDQGVLVDADPVDVAQQLWAGMHGLVSLRLRGLGFVEDVDAHRHRLVGTMLRGLSRAAG